MTSKPKLLLLKPEWKVPPTGGSRDNANKIFAESLAKSLSDRSPDENQDEKESNTSEYFNHPDTDTRFFRKVSEFEWSVRSRNCLKKEKIVYLGDLVEKTEGQLLRLPNLGRKSLNEIKNVLAGISLHLGMNLPNWPPENIEDLARNVNAPDAASSLKNLNIELSETAGLSEKVNVILSSILSDRQMDIVFRRFGVFRSKETLEDIASDYNITRERVRQIEAKSLQKCNLPVYKGIFEKLLSESKTDIQNILFRDGQLLSKKSLEMTSQDLSGAQILLITIGDGSLEKWLERNYYPVEQDGQFLAWATSGRFVSEYDDLFMSLQAEESTSARLKNAIEHGVWPMPLQDLVTNIPDIPPSLIRKSLVEEFAAEFENEKIVSMKKLPTKTRFILVLRMAGHALTGSELVGYHKTLFNTEISESVARNCLASLDEALIVGRGKYNLYENLRFSEVELANIRDQVSNYLTELGQFVSSKKIYTDIFVDHLENYSEHLTDYMLLGILQDDRRFDVRRGLMVGLSTPEFDGQFNLLADEVWGLVNEQGPLSISEIKRLLSATRDVLDTSILASLQNLDDIVADKSGKYNLANRVFGNPGEFKKIRVAIRVNLRARPLSLFALKGRLALVGINLPRATLRSMVMSDTLLEYSEKLISIDVNLCSDLKEYDENVRAATERSASYYDIEDIIGKKAPHQLEYLMLDAGLLDAQETSHSNEDDYLDEIFGEFKF